MLLLKGKKIHLLKSDLSRALKFKKKRHTLSARRKTLNACGLRSARGVLNRVRVCLH